MKTRRNERFFKMVSVVARSQDGMRPVFEMCEGLRQAMQPFADLQEGIQKIGAPLIKVREQMSAVERITEIQGRFARDVGKLQLGPLVASAENLAMHARNAQALDEAGWLPHYSTPLDHMQACEGDKDAIHSLLSRYYREQWPEVRRDIESRLMEYDLDDEAKATFREALAAHDAGLYRSVCRVLMPEIERVARKELHGDGQGGITSQVVLRELAGRLPISLVEPGGFLGVKLFGRLSNHLYEHVDDEETRHRLALDPVPNRHAAVHGLVVYSTMQNSLNAVFMTDYIFQLISLLKGLDTSTWANREIAKQGTRTTDC